MAQPKTLDEAITFWLQQQIETTEYSYRYPIRNMADFCGPARPLDKIDSATLAEYVLSVRNRPEVNSPATIGRYTKTIKAFFNYCVRMGWLDKSPADALRYVGTSKRIRKDKAMTDAELEQILDYAKWRPRDYALILFLADTGCRAGGAAGLQVQDINFEAMTAIVTEKGNKTRTVWFGPETRRALEDWLKRRPRDAGAYVFSMDGARLKNAIIGQIIRRITKKIGIRSLGSHSLRHRKAFQMADHRVVPSVAATALGHESPSILLEFYYPRDDEDRAAAVMRSLVYGEPGGPQPEEQPAATKQEEQPSRKIIDFQQAVNR